MQGSDEGASTQGGMGSSAATAPGDGVGASVDRRVVRTRKAIRKAFMRLIQETDYQKITITAIAREADIDRKTFYLHYRSVEDLTDEIIQDEADRIAKACVESLSGSDSTQIVLSLVKQLSAGLAPDPKNSRRIISHIPYEQVLDKLEGSLTASLIENDTLGLSSMGPYLNYCVAFFSAGFVAVIRRWMCAGSDVSLENIAEVTHVAARQGIDGVLKMMPEVSAAASKE